MESCCRACLPCCSCLWDRIWPGLRYPGPRDHVIANPAAHAAEIRTVSGDIRVPAPKKRPAQLYAALFDFEARSDDELTVKEGDKLSVIEKRGDYVLAKKLTGSLESGLVPANYVALLQDEFAKHNRTRGRVGLLKFGLIQSLQSITAQLAHLDPLTTPGMFITISESSEGK
uniref:non-specific protein-tyrosine kinase n=1 Tax=Astatotilapia calliptera TaxID=8154 RepID=A0AAX7U6G2_ASTCA